MAKAAIGLFDSESAAETAVRELHSQNFASEDVQLVANRRDVAEEPTMGGPREDQGSDSGIGTGVGTAIAGATYHTGIIRALVKLGVPEPQAEEYDEGVRRGGALVIVKTNDERADAAAGFMNRQGAVRVEERVPTWTASGWKRQFQSTTSERGLSPRHMEPESVQVGRDRIDSGGARVFVW